MIDIHTTNTFQIDSLNPVQKSNLSAGKYDKDYERTEQEQLSLEEQDAQNMRNDENYYETQEEIQEDVIDLTKINQED